MQHLPNLSSTRPSTFRGTSSSYATTVRIRCNPGSKYSETWFQLPYGSRHMSPLSTSILREKAYQAELEGLMPAKIRNKENKGQRIIYMSYIRIVVVQVVRGHEIDIRPLTSARCAQTHRIDARTSIPFCLKIIVLFPKIIHSSHSCSQLINRLQTVE